MPYLSPQAQQQLQQLKEFFDKSKSGKLDYKDIKDVTPILDGVGLHQELTSKLGPKGESFWKDLRAQVAIETKKKESKEWPQRQEQQPILETETKLAVDRLYDKLGGGKGKDWPLEERNKKVLTLIQFVKGVERDRHISKSMAAKVIMEDDTLLQELARLVGFNNPAYLAEVLKSCGMRYRIHSDRG